MTTSPLPKVPGYFRWMVLAIVSLVCFAQYFIYDSVTPLGTMIREANINRGQVTSVDTAGNSLTVETKRGPKVFRVIPPEKAGQKAASGEVFTPTEIALLTGEPAPKNADGSAGKPPSVKKTLPEIQAGSWVTVYFHYDSGSFLTTNIEIHPSRPSGETEGGLGFSGTSYGQLFSAYAWANVFLLMLLLAGILVDKLGIKISGILYAFLCFLGAAITALGAMDSLPSILGPLYTWLQTAFFPEWSTELKVMLLGRAIFGLGAESILVVNNKVLARWFKGKELAFAFGLNLTIMRLGTFLALTIQVPVADAWGLRNALWFAATLMLVGFSTFFLYLWLERISRGREGAPTGEVGISPEEQFRLKDVFKFTPSFWFISLLCVTFYSAIFPFQSYLPDILVQKFKYSDALAGVAASCLIFGTMIFTPIFGFFVDKYGKRATLMIFGSLMLVPCHLLLGYTHFLPIVPIFVAGIALSLVPAALWAAIPMMVPENRLGTAFGVIGYIQNVGLWLFPMLAGKIADAHTTQTVVNGKPVAIIDYTWTMLMFSTLGIVGFVFALCLKWADKRRKEGESIEAVMTGAPAAAASPAPADQPA
ncbi:MAG: MFS transporter [Acidobacteria bacterium]|nr:MFS transporter [Acidobacteriota bacterium]